MMLTNVQVLPPTDIYTRIPQLYCAHDSHNAGDTTTNTFMESLERVGEGDQWYGVSYEMWGQVGDRGARYLLPTVHIVRFLWRGRSCLEWHRDR